MSTPTDKPPQADASQLWSKPVDYSTDDRARALGYEDEARRMTGAVGFAPEGDRAFFEKKAQEAGFMARQAAGNAQFQQQQYQQAAFAVEKHNEPIEAALRAQQEAEARAKAAALAQAAIGMAATVAVVDAVGSSGGLTSAVGGLFAGTGPATTMGMGPAAMFGGLAATPAKLGIAPTLAIAGVAIDDVAKASKSVQAEMAASAAPTAPEAKPAAAPVAPVARATNMAMELANNSLAFGPKRPSWAAEKPVGGSGTPSA